MIGSAVQGGQIAAHNFRMTNQVIKTSFLISLTLALSYLFYQLIQVPLFYWKAGFYHLIASIFKTSSIPVDSTFWSQLTSHSVQTNKIQIPAKQLLNNTAYYNSIMEAFLWENLVFSAYVFLVVLIMSYGVFIIIGKKLKKRQLVSGKPLISAGKLSLKLKLSCKASDLKLANLNLVKGTETKHFLVTGSTGSGKSNCFFHLLNQIRDRQNRAIIVDTTGVFVDRYYRPGKDVILNPFDIRNAPWNPWIECREKSDFDYVAKSLIPDLSTQSNPFWQTSAQVLLSAVFQKTNQRQSICELVKWLLYTDLGGLSDFVKDTKAASIINLDSEKTSASIRAITSSYLNCFEYLPDVKNPFSIRKWVEEEKDDAWLFLSTTPLQRATISPLLSTWYSIASNSLRSLSINHKRRIWFVIDELPSLPRLFELETFLSEARKYGGCSLISIQAISQLHSIYGRDIANTIIANSLTRIVFNEGDMRIAKEISSVFGELEYNEYNESLSYGANEIRDGVNLSLNTKIRSLVHPSELSSLQPNQAFIKLPGDYPITKIKLSIAK